MKKLLLSIILIAFGVTIHAQITYVNSNATGANTGTSWADAYTDLHSATFNTTSGEIWVAQGTYIPSKTFTGNIPANNSQKTFRIQYNVQVYGGFNGTETMLSERNWINNPTIISGNVGGGLKSYNVIRFDANNNTTVLDGFTVQDGQANGTTELYGGAIYLTNSASPTIRNCKFLNNIAQQHGGAVYASGGSPVFENCEFKNNSTNLYDAGALYVTNATTTNIVNCLFNGNIAARYAGAIVVQNTTTSFITNCTFVNNQRGPAGFGKSIFHSVSAGTPVLTISNCIFYNNSPGQGDEVNKNGTTGAYHVKNCFSQTGTSDFTTPGTTSNNVSGNPFFTDFNNSDFTLQCKSPAVNTGNASGLTIPATDLNGNPRTVATIDMGAYENNSTTIGIEANKTSICLGDHVTLRGTCDPAGYTWSNGVTNGIAFYPTTTQTYTCTGLTAGSTDQITIEVVSITNENVSGPSGVCAGSNATINLANSVNGAQYYLRDNATDIIVDGPINGTGSSIDFTASNLLAPTTYNVVGLLNPEESPIPDYAVDFDGSNDKIITNYYFPTTNNLTIEAWIYPEASSYKRILTNFSGSNQYASDVIFDTYNATNNGRGLRLVIGTSATASVPNALTLSAWNHVAATFNNGAITLYVNGASVGSFTVGTTTLLTNVVRSLTIGEDYMQGSSSEYFNGRIDEVRIWNKTLSQSEIAANMNTCLKGNEDGLEVYYRMNEASGTTITDLSGNGYNGTLVTSDAANHWLSSNISCGSVLTTNTLGHALDFDGADDKVATTFTLPATNAFTIETWVYPRSSNYDRFISNYASPLNGAIIIDSYNATDNGRGARFNVYGTGNALFSIGAANALTSLTWNHIACTFNNGSMSLYVNGFEVANGTAPFTSIPQIATSFAFGEDNVPGAAEYLNGKMDEVRFWNKALNQSEIMSGMNNCLTGSETDLLAYYNFENGTGTIVSDICSGQKDGIMQNMNAATDWVDGKFSCEVSCSTEMTQTVTVNVTAVNNAITYNSFYATASQTGATYRWLNCDNGYAVIPGETAQTFTPTVNGNYAAEVTMGFCTDTSACVNFNAVSLKTFGTESFVLFPNPTSNNLTIKSQESIEKIEVYNMLGALIQTETNSNFSVEQLPVGMYIIQIKTANGTGTTRFIKN